MKTVSVTKLKPKRAKKDEVDWELVESFRRGLEDFINGRFTEWKPKTR